MQKHTEEKVDLVLNKISPLIASKTLASISHPQQVARCMKHLIKTDYSHLKAAGIVCAPSAVSDLHINNAQLRKLNNNETVKTYLLTLYHFPQNDLFP